MNGKGCEKTVPSVVAAADPKDRVVEERNQLKERINRIVDGSTLEELQILLITIRGVLRKD